MLDIGSTIRLFREIKGYSQQGLADSIGVSQKTISRIECGENSPSLQLIEKISEEFEIDISLIIRSKRDLLAQLKKSNINMHSTANQGSDIEKIYDELFREKDRHIKALEKEVKWLKKKRKS